MKFLLLAIVLLATACNAQAGWAAKPLNLLSHSQDEKPNLKEISPGQYEWSLSDGKSQTLRIDLAAEGINLADYDEFRFDIMPVGAQVGIHFIIEGYPASDSVSSRYLKTKTPMDEWSHVRFELATDDDGIYLQRNKNEKDGTLLITLSKRVLGFPNEPVGRKALIRNPRFVKRVIGVEADFSKSVSGCDSNGIFVKYPIKVHNFTKEKQSIALSPDSTHSLKYFKIEAPETLLVNPGGSSEACIVLRMPLDDAMALPPLYSEPAIPEFSVKDIVDSDIIPLASYRPRPFWGVVPLFNKITWTPATFGAYLDERKKNMPSIEAWAKNTVAAADMCLPIPCIMPDKILPGHTMGCICDACGGETVPLNTTDFSKHKCSKCGKLFENVEAITRAYVGRYYYSKAHEARNCALAWLVSGDRKYADKSIEILLAFAKAYPEMPIAGARSTSGGTKLACNSLLSSYILPVFSEAFYFLSTSFENGASVNGAAIRSQIAAFLVDEGLQISRHSTEYSNQTAEHIRAYGTAGLVSDCLPLVGEAIYGEFGYHALVEYAFSEDGITHEAGAYHTAIFGALNDYAYFNSLQNVNLYTSRFKRVFDGSITAGLTNTSYESAYRFYRDQAYLNVLEKQRASPIASEQMIMNGILGIPKAGSIPSVSALMRQAGYVFLRKGDSTENMELRTNYIKPFDRGELDRFSIFLFKNGTQVDSSAGRIIYSSPYGHWMYETAAHNAIVINGKNEVDVDGTLALFDPNPSTPSAVVSTNPANTFYPGVNQTRGIALIKNAYVVFDIIKADNELVIDRYQHGIGNLTCDLAAAPTSIAPACIPEAGHFSEIKESPSTDTAELKFANGLSCRIVSNNKFKLYTVSCFGGWRADKREVAFARFTGARSALFVTAYKFGEDNPFTDLKILSFDGKFLRFCINWKDTAYTVEYDIAGKHLQIKENL